MSSRISWTIPFTAFIFNLWFFVSFPVAHSNDSKFIGLYDSLNNPLFVSVNENSQITFSCGQISGGQRPLDVTWIKDGFKISSQMNFTGNELDFTISKAEKKDAGLYRCLLKNKYGSLLSSVTKVTVSFMSNFIPDEDVSSEIRTDKNYVILSPPRLDVEPMEDLMFTWFYEDQIIQPTIDRFISDDGKLVLLNIVGSDSGKYHVSAYHRRLNRSLRSRDVNLIVESTSDAPLRPNIILGPRNIKRFRVAESGTNKSNEFILECIATCRNSRYLRIDWFHNESQILQSKNRKYKLEEFNRRLIVSNPSQQSDSGVYSCQATLEGFPSLNDKKEAWVEIYDFPHVRILTDSESNVVHIESRSRLELPCLLVGPAKSTISWYFNGQDVKKSSFMCCDDSSLFEATDSDSLIIKHMNDRTAGTYQCEASYNGQVSPIATVHLKEDELRLGDSTEVIPTSNVSFVSGEPVTLPCKHSDSKHSNKALKWTLNDSEITTGDQNFGLNEAGSLTFIVDDKHVGYFRCFRDQNLVYQTFVNVVRKIQIAQGPVNQSAIIGSNVVFSCDVSSSEGNSFVRQWYFKNQLLPNNPVRNVEIMPDGRLFIKQVWSNNMGAYSCSITSGSGVQRQTGYLEIVEKPGMPLFVKARLINDTLPAKIEVTWAEGFDGNSPIIKFSVGLRTMSGQNLWSDWETAVENVAKDQRSVIVDNLKPSANYQFRVVAYNRLGAGVWSQPSNNLVMPQQPPAAAPRSVAGSARSASTIMLQWQPPPADQWNGDILGYVLRYRLANYPDIPWIIVNVTESRARNFLLQDLITWREYEIQVAAYNERGMGVFSKATYITTLEGVPVDHPYDVTVTVLNSTSVSLTFVPPPQQMIPGVNLGYKVELWKRSSNQTDEQPDKLIKILPYSLIKIDRVLIGLEKYTTYNLTVLCYTAQGDGPKSPPIEFKTKQDLPDVVKNLLLQEILFDSAKLTWDTPSNPNGILTNYTLIYWVANETDSKRTISIAAYSTSYKIQGLTASTKYALKFFAFTEIGPGPAQTITFVSGVPPELPGPPSALTISNIEARSAILQFTPGFDGKTVISKWIVEALTGLSTNWTEIFNISAPNDKSIKITSLKPFTSYRLRMYAENVKGRSAASEATEAFETLQTAPDAIENDVEVRPISPTSMRLTWTPLQLHAWNGLAKGYEIAYYKNDSFADARKKTIFFNDTVSGEYEIHSLKPYVFYAVQISAVGEVGKGVASQLIVKRTYESKPSSAPSTFRILNVGSRNVKVSWSNIPEEKANGKILGYKIKVSSTNFSEFNYLEREVVIESSRNIADIENLMPFYSYMLNISAFNIAGLGPTAILSFRTKEDVPSEPTQLMFPFVNDDEVRIVWKPPRRPNGIISRYSVSYWSNQSETGRKGQIKTTLNADLQMFVATGIAHDVPYTFAVAAENGAGYSPESLALVQLSRSKSIPGSPSRPIRNNEKLPGPYNITVDFDHELDPYNRFFVLEYQSKGDTFWLTYPERIRGNAKSFAVNGLVPNKFYAFRIKSVNDFGESRPSLQSDWIRSGEFLPKEPPSDILIRLSDSSSIELNFTTPNQSTWNSDQVGFRISYFVYNVNDSTNDSQAVVQLIEVPLDGPERRKVVTNIDDLKQFEHYAIFVETFNQVGSSRPSDAVLFYVGHSLPKSTIKGLEGTALSSTEIQLSWDAWSDREELINGFKVSYKSVSHQNREAKQDIIPRSSIGFTLRDLSKFTNYSIELSVFNRAGRGPITRLFVQTFADKPGAIRNLKFSDIQLDSLNVSWQPPLEPNGIILNYVVIYKTFKMDGAYTKQIQEKTTMHHLPVTNLEENATIVFTVQAETVIGSGPAVQGKVTVGPQKGSPGVPDRPTVLPSETSIKLTWRMPREEGLSHINSFLIQFYVETRPISSHSTTHESEFNRKRRNLLTQLSSAVPKWVTLTHVENIFENLKGSDTVDYTISYSQLEPNTIHRFRIIARNSHGVSYPSEESDPVVVPNLADDDSFYLQWWFLVILALASLVVVIIVIAALYVTGNRDDKDSISGKRTSSVNSINLIDGGVVTYEMRTSQKVKNRKIPSNALMTNQYVVAAADDHNNRKNPNLKHQQQNQLGYNHGGHQTDDNSSLFHRDNVSFGEDDDVQVLPQPISTKSGRKSALNKDTLTIANAGGSSKLPSFYETLNNVENFKSNDLLGARMKKNSLDRGRMLREADYHMEPEVSSIVQHYETSSDATYRENWRQAVRAAAQAQTSDHNGGEDGDDSFSTTESLNNHEPEYNDNNLNRNPLRGHSPRTNQNDDSILIGYKNRPGFSSFV